MYAGRIVETARKDRLLDNPKHPYTAALISSANLSGEVRERYETIEGSPPDLKEDLSRCAFADRCPYDMPLCYSEIPPCIEVEKGHEVCCRRFA
jgi:oligopeptide/dipeptide ABC transporter ATP-binding protein